MSNVAFNSEKKDFESTGAVAAKVHKIRITLTSKNVRNLEKGKGRPLGALGGLVDKLQGEAMKGETCEGEVTKESTTLVYKVLTLLPYSLRRLDCAFQGQGPPRQGTRPSPDQGPQDHHQEDCARFPSRMHGSRLTRLGYSLVERDPRPGTTSR